MLVCGPAGDVSVATVPVSGKGVLPSDVGLDLAAELLAMAEVSWTGLVAREALVFSAVALVPVSVDSVVAPEGKNFGVLFATVVFPGIGLVSLGLEVALEAVGISAVPLVPSEVLVSARGEVVGLEFSTVLWATVAVLPSVVAGRGAKVVGTDVLLDISVDLPDGIAGETVVVSSFARVMPSISAVAWGVLIFGRTVDISVSIEELAVVGITDLLVLSAALTPEFSGVLLPPANVLSVWEGV